MSMGVSLSLKDMYHASTLGAMAALVAQRKSDSWVPEVIDWDTETALAGSLDASVSDGWGPPRKEGGLGVLMTGSTDFLGGAILASLLKSPQVAKIHCITVDHGSEPSQLEDQRVVVHDGSLLEPLLGLREDVYERF
ncbi:hybrid PKS-NRPS synthetase lepA [Colletotrichum spaethianum]|uniref:Hybrid PKS-NRPS synthetase lepA n=1 Tax=Colletotrichum spaethianum TaxID=700344 RepID=A0AA37UQV3_9PEZI|nr:hybrid PKS-NRPS synthetase lepA [Colletotrichum spaethianum]GKT49532.1 hybrid PKS-NRPS synthetase lepA [Colletotrichum spaethianum]